MSSGRGRAPGRATMDLDASGDGVVIVMAGEFDISNADQLRAELEKATATGLPIVIDATGIAFADSSVVAAMLRCVQQTGPLEIRNASLLFRRIVETSGLTEHLRITP